MLVINQKTWMIGLEPLNAYNILLFDGPGEMNFRHFRKCMNPLNINFPKKHILSSVIGLPLFKFL